VYLVAVDRSHRPPVTFVHPRRGAGHAMSGGAAMRRSPERVARYRDRGYWRDQSIGSLVRTWADRYESRTAVIDADTRLTYRELCAQVEEHAAALTELGLRPGDTVLVQLPNCVEFVVVMLACMRAGVIPTLLLPTHREHELTSVGRHVTARAIVVPGRHATADYQAMARRAARECPSIRHVLVAGAGAEPGSVGLRDLVRAGARPQAPAASDIALLLLSSGTTGSPKVIPRTHDDYEYSARGSSQVCGFGPDTTYLAALPAAHTFTLGCPGILGTLINGGRVVLVNFPSPELVFAATARHRVTATAAVPAVLRRWLDAYDPSLWDLSSLRLLQVGGSRPSPALVRQAVSRLPCALQQVYGMSEGLLNLTRLDDPPEVVATTQGRPMSPDDETRIVDQYGVPVADGLAGELLTRGPGTISGYFRADEDNIRCFTHEGWYRTGDRVRRTPSGNLVLEGRMKDVINRGGEKISAAELEDILRSLPQVAQVAVVAVPDEELGERVCACVVLQPGTSLTLDEVRAVFLAARTAAYKIPERVEIMRTLPRTPLGKISKQQLRAQLTMARTPRQASV
jgi:2,3-dihydroxybenzoate-AMP ligase